MRVLVSFVGKRDPWAEDNTEGPILTLARCLQPDWVVLFPTARIPGAEEEETETHASLVVECLTKEEICSQERCYVLPIPLSDPRDYAKILDFINRNLPEALPQEGPAELLVNLSSGTPQMQISWLVAGNAGLLPGARYFEVSRPPRSGQPGAPRQRVKEMNPNFLREGMIQRQLAETVRLGLFASAAGWAKELASVATGLGRSVLAEKLGQLMQAYSAWDALDYEAASARLKAVRDYLAHRGVPAELGKLLDEQAAVLQKLVRQVRESPLNLMDIYHNSVRCLQRGAHADCLARFYRLYEGSLYMRLRRCGIEPRDLGASSCQPPAVADLLSREITSLRAAQAETLLLEVDQQAAKALRQEVEVAHGGGVRRGTLKGLAGSLREIRHRSVVGHNMRPVSATDAHMAVQVGALLLEVLCGISSPDDYPFSLKRLETVVSTLCRV